MIFRKQEKTDFYDERAALVRLMFACLVWTVLVFAPAFSITAKAATPATDSRELASAGLRLSVPETITKEEVLKYAQDKQGDYFGYTNIGISDVESFLNVRAAGSTSADIVGRMLANAACEVISESDDGWALIKSGEVEGYVSLEYLLTGANAIKRAREVNDKEGELTVALTLSEAMYGAGISDIRADICNRAIACVGNPYVPGGVSLTNGCDCSGFTLTLYAKYGINISHSPAVQATQGTSITFEELQPGDLIYYARGGGIQHVTIYIGNGEVISASSPERGIVRCAYNYREPVRYVRFFSE